MQVISAPTPLAWVLTFSFAIACPVFANGTLIGDGGDAVHCEPSPGVNEFDGYYSLDYLVTFTGDRSYYQEVTTAEDSIDNIMALIEAKVPTIAPSIQNFTHHILNDDWTRDRIWEPRPFGLLDLTDEALIELVPMNCRAEENRVAIVQAVNRQDSEMAGAAAGKVIYHYVPSVFDDIRDTDEMQLSFLMIHEWLWDLSDNVARNRRINRFLHSRDFRTMSAQQVKEQLAGMGLTIPLVPVEPVPMEFAIDIQAGGGFGCGLKSGRVYCFGSNSYGQATVPENLPPIQQIALAGLGVCALDVDNRIHCWGHGIAPAPALGNVGSIFAGGMACATTAMGSQCWRNQEIAEIPFNLPLEAAADVSVGLYHGCHILDGKVSCWGGDHQNQVSDVPDLVRSPWRVFAGDSASCVVGGDGLQCWGRSRFEGGHIDEMPDFSAADGIDMSLHDERWTACAIFDSAIGCWLHSAVHGFERLAIPPLRTRRPKKITVGYGLACVLGEYGVECWTLSHYGSRIVDEMPIELTVAR